jgi:predicted nicotinamide N-methyase
MEHKVRNMPSSKLMERVFTAAPVELCPHITALQSERIFDFWEEWESESGQVQDVPFWAVVWPAAAVLARFILENDYWVKGKRVLDLGCGSGVSSIACVMAGAAHVKANDIDLFALEMASANAALNGVSFELSSVNLLTAGEFCEADTVLVADMFYNERQSILLLDFLKKMRTAGSKILIADAGRPFAPKDGVKLLWSQSVNVNKEIEGVDKRIVNIITIDN